MEEEDAQIWKKQIQNWCNRRLSITFALGTHKNETSATEWHKKNVRQISISYGKRF